MRLLVLLCVTTQRRLDSLGVVCLEENILTDVILGALCGFRVRVSLVYDWRYTANQFFLEPNLLRLMN
jgi:hypothetical protein